jgi:hypothetical protein
MLPPLPGMSTLRLSFLREFFIREMLGQQAELRSVQGKFGRFGL